MSRYKEPFTIFPRKLNSGKIIYYYRTYNSYGERSVAHSTGQSNKTLARNYCAKLLSEGNLYPVTTMKFSVYADGFFSQKSQWYKDKVQAGTGKQQPVAQKTVKTYNHMLNDYILPFFKNVRISDVNAVHIKNFRNWMIKNSIANSSINLACVCLRIIFKYAMAEKLINTNPMDSIQQMYIDAKVREAVSEENIKYAVKKLKNQEQKLFIIIAASTGMRISEIMAIRNSSVHEDYIEVADQRVNNTFCPVKDGERRKVRICRTLSRKLTLYIKSCGLLPFPKNHDYYRRAFYAALPYSNAERIKRKITFHSIRHFFNTYLLANGISEIKVKSIMGHSSGKGSMTERYANFKPEDFDDVSDLQEKLISRI